MCYQKCLQASLQIRYSQIQLTQTLTNALMHNSDCLNTDLKAIFSNLKSMWRPDPWFILPDTQSWIHKESHMTSPPPHKRGQTCAEWSHQLVEVAEVLLSLVFILLLPGDPAASGPSSLLVYLHVLFKLFVLGDQSLLAPLLPPQPTQSPRWHRVFWLLDVRLGDVKRVLWRTGNKTSELTIFFFCLVQRCECRYRP